MESLMYTGAARHVLMKIFQNIDVVDQLMMQYGDWDTFGIDEFSKMEGWHRCTLCQNVYMEIQGHKFEDNKHRYFDWVKDTTGWICNCCHNQAIDIVKWRKQDE